MASLTEQLDALIAEHGLASVSITRLALDGGGCFWSVNAQAEMPNGAREIGTCRDSITEPGAGLASAIADLNAKRARVVSVPVLAEAA